MRCEYCGRAIKPGDWQCSGCGAPIDYSIKQDFERQEAEVQAEKQRQEAEAQRQRQEAEAQAEKQRQEAEAQTYNSTKYNLYQKYGEIGRQAYGGLIARTTAFMIDIFIASLISLIPVVGGFGIILYIILGDSSVFDGQTIGKRVMCLKVVNMDYETISVKRSICRNLCKYFTFYIGGFITIPFSKRKRAVHDLMCGTCIIKTN